MGNVSSSGVFPTPYDSSLELLPGWAIAVVCASAGVTLLWTVSIILLVVFEVLGKRQDPPTLHTAHSQASLGSPPPPITPPTPRRLQVSTSPRLDLSEVTVNPGFLESPSQKPAEQQLPPAAELPEVKKKPVSGGASACMEPGTTDLSSTPLAGMVLSRPITVRQLGATLREPNYLNTEFKKLPVPNVSPDSLPTGVERKNRYSNVLPTPRTRVTLNSLASDYINANFMRGYKGTPKQYIATQGPLESTQQDFWTMVWENRSEVIVMATNFQEKGIDKCSRYWPGSGSAVYGVIEVTVLSQSTQPTYNKIKLQVRHVGGEEVRCVDHYRLTVWPQHGLPQDTSVITDFIREVRLCDSSGPAVVHCSAGIGRTGLLIALDIGLRALNAGDSKLDILRIVSTARQDRAGCVQTRDQYRFLHQCLYDYAKSTLK